MRNILKDLLTRKMIEQGYKQGIIKLTTYADYYNYVEQTKDDKVGVICVIGDHWFYFGGEEAEISTVEEYKNNIPENTIIGEIYDTLLGFGDDWEFYGDECMYYYYYLEEHLSFNDCKSWSYDTDKDDFVCPDCGGDALKNLTGVSIESNYCPYCGVRLHKWDNAGQKKL